MKPPSTTDDVANFDNAIQFLKIFAPGSLPSPCVVATKAACRLSRSDNESRFLQLVLFYDLFDDPYILRRHPGSGVRRCFGPEYSRDESGDGPTALEYPSQVCDGAVATRPRPDTDGEGSQPQCLRAVSRVKCLRAVARVTCAKVKGATWGQHLSLDKGRRVKTLSVFLRHGGSTVTPSVGTRWAMW